ncbi:response regulator [Dyella flagellata]|uniref:Response regulator n=1 Tax=Dyella flagellata TaxID=1867833 RepID=A0ABQ5XGN6_9GAMM|nr:response regulator [Dyella flagellata]GLQ90813.1 response regulator [Dyella flagellata]
MKPPVLRPILLVEDSPVDAEMTLEALRQAHLANPVIHLEDGVDCLDWLYARGAFAGREDDEPVVMLLDIKMPRMNGLDVLTKMRSDERFRLMPVVILSSSREESDLARSWDLGVNAYVIKPVDVEQFFQAVRTLGQFWALLNQAPEPG